MKLKLSLLLLALSQITNSFGITRKVTIKKTIRPLPAVRIIRPLPAVRIVRPLPAVRIIRPLPNPKIIIHTIQKKQIKIADKLDSLKIAIPCNIISKWSLTSPTFKKITKAQNSLEIEAQYNDGSLLVNAKNNQITINYTNWNNESFSKVITLTRPIRNFKFASIDWSKYMAGCNHINIEIPR